MESNHRHTGFHMPAALPSELPPHIFFVLRYFQNMCVLYTKKSIMQYFKVFFLVNFSLYLLL